MLRLDERGGWQKQERQDYAMAETGDGGGLRLRAGRKKLPLRWKVCRKSSSGISRAFIWEWGGGEVGEGSQKVPASSYEINKSRGCKVQHSNYS